MVAAVQAPDQALSRPVYDAPHVPRPWGAKVSAYLWTKSIAAGALLVAAVSGSSWWGTTLSITAPAISLLFVLLTTALLVVDLKRPERFLYILFKPNWRSWLVWGAWILIAFGAAAGAWLAAGLAGHYPADGVRMPVALLALATAGYSALLFGQAEGRDFWQSPLVLPHLVLGAATAGAATLLLAAVFLTGDARVAQGLSGGLWLLLVAGALVLFAETFTTHASHDAARAARLLTRGAYRGRFWWGVVGAGTIVPILLLTGPFFPAGSILASLLALFGLWLWEDLWVRAGQALPLS